MNVETIRQNFLTRSLQKKYVSSSENYKVSLIGLKSQAEKILPRNSIRRTLILTEPDYLPRAEAIAKVEVYVLLLYEEFKVRFQLLI